VAIWTIGFSYIVILSLLILAELISVFNDIDIGIFTRDPAFTLRANPFTGFISHIGILIWSGTVSICFFTSIIIKKMGDTKISQFLFFSGLFILLLLLDDLFMFHEEYFYMFFHVPEKGVYLGYLILSIIYTLKFRSLLAKTEYAILLIACGFFALSMGLDWFLETFNTIFEDGFKLFGITTLCIYFTRTCLTQLRLLKGVDI